MASDFLILPGDPLFYATLAAPPPVAQGDGCYVARAGSGLLEPATPQQIREYLEGGEYDARLGEIDLEDDFMGLQYGEGEAW